MNERAKKTKVQKVWKKYRIKKGVLKSTVKLGNNEPDSLKMCYMYICTCNRNESVNKQIQIQNTTGLPVFVRYSDDSL